MPPVAEQYFGKGAYFIGEFGLIRPITNLYGDNLQIKENFRYSPFVIGLKFSFLLSIFLVKVNFYLDEGFGFA